MTDREKVSIWITPETKKRIKKIAVEQTRSMSNLIEVILRGYLKKK